MDPQVRSRGRGKTIFLAVVGVAAAIAEVVWYLMHRGIESTDDAQIVAVIVSVPARTGGTVTKVLFTDNQMVKQYDVLAELDAEPAKARLALAEANLKAAQASADVADADERVAESNATGNHAAAAAQVSGASSNVMASREQIAAGEADVASAQANYDKAKLELTRAKSLFDQGAVAKVSLDQAQATFDAGAGQLASTKARVASLRASASQASSRVIEANARLEQANNVDVLIAQARAKAAAAHAQVTTAEAQRHLAELDLSYVEIRAPQDGEVSKKSVDVGEVVAAGQPIAELVPAQEMWVTADFKEGQLTEMRVGQPVEIEVDAFSSVTLHGTVQSFAAATGARFSLLPPDNATGNYTKVVQRVPVRIKLDKVPASVAASSRSFGHRQGGHTQVSSAAHKIAPPLGVTTAPRAPAAVAPDADTGVSNKWLIAIAVALGALLEVVDTSIVNVALNEMQNSLGATLSEVSWVVSSYAVANVIILPMTAWLGERFGKKRYFIFSLIAFTGASVMCGLSTTLPMLIVARVLQGLGGGGLLAKAQSILFETFPKSEQAMAQGFFGAIVIAGPAIGPTLGGWIVTNVDWRWIFFVNIPIGIGAVMMCMTFLPADKRSDRVTGSIDWAGIGLLAVGLGSLQTVLEEGQTDDWFDSPFIVKMAILAGVSLVAFVWRELTADRSSRGSQGAPLSLAVGGERALDRRRDGALWRALRGADLRAGDLAHDVAADRHAALAGRDRLGGRHADRRAPDQGDGPAAHDRDRGRHHHHCLVSARGPHRADRRRRLLLAAHHPLVRHGHDVPAAQPGDDRLPAQERHGQGDRLLQPDPPDGR